MEPKSGFKIPKILIIIVFSVSLLFSIYFGFLLIFKFPITEIGVYLSGKKACERLGGDFRYTPPVGFDCHQNEGQIKINGKIYNLGVPDI